MQVEWFNNPKYMVARERLISALTSPNYRFRRSGAVVFLCGKFQSSARDDLARYLRLQVPNIQLFYAEQIWEQVSKRLPLGALALESSLAKLSDLVIIIVESPGTFAELGAFANNDELRPKLLAIVHSDYRPPQESFIALGPIQWIEQDSSFRPTIYVPLETILMAASEVEERISRIKTMGRKVSDLGSDPKHLFLFVVDLVSIAYPLTVDTVEAYCEEILNLPPDPPVAATSLAIGKAIGLLASIDIAGVTYYAPADLGLDGKTFHHLHHTTLPGLRAEYLAALQTIPEARSVMDELRRHLAR